MEATASRPQRAFEQKKEKNKLPGPRVSHISEDLTAGRANSVGVQADVRQENSRQGFNSHQVLFYTLVLLTVVVCIIIVWILPHFHPGLFCFLLVPTCWFYKDPLQRALDWAKRRLRSWEQAH